MTSCLSCWTPLIDTPCSSNRYPSRICPACITGVRPMPFIIRPYRRLPAICPVTYERLFEDGEGAGLRLSGTLPLAVGDMCSLNVKLAGKSHVSILAGVVRWTRGEELGIETLLVEKKSKVRLEAYIQDRMSTVRHRPSSGTLWHRKGVAPASS